MPFNANAGRPCSRQLHCQHRRSYCRRIKRALHPAPIAHHYRQQGRSRRQHQRQWDGLGQAAGELVRLAYPLTLPRKVEVLVLQ